ncbi:hypothetical protein [Lacticaseibacillus salsurivasis]|uniref:hypothetical protein n=1 Tax=Lacticaseibacillus salsurivasis TaxID=3081441 RepID=UPI0030C67CC9
MKSFVIGRKNWLFATSPMGAEANAIWMTLVETAKANELDPRGYVEQLMENLSQYRAEPTEEQPAAHLPWHQDEAAVKQTA